jgi:hypothetical protein
MPGYLEAMGVDNIWHYLNSGVLFYPNVNGLEDRLMRGSEWWNTRKVIEKLWPDQDVLNSPAAFGPGERFDLPATFNAFRFPGETEKVSDDILWHQHGLRRHPEFSGTFDVFDSEFDQWSNGHAGLKIDAGT